MNGILRAAFFMVVAMMAFQPDAAATGTPGFSQTWSACWPGIVCQVNGPATCTTSATSSSCSYAQGGGSVCNYSSGPFNCTSVGPAFCYMAD